MQQSIHSKFTARVSGKGLPIESGDAAQVSREVRGQVLCAWRGVRAGCVCAI